MDRIRALVVISILVLGINISPYAQNINFKFLDTIEITASNFQDAFQHKQIDSTTTKTFAIDDIYAVIRYWDSGVEFNPVSQDCVIGSKGSPSVIEFYDAKTNKLISISEAFLINFDFTYFILRFESGYFFTPWCFITYANSKLYVQNDIEYSDSITRNRATLNHNNEDTTIRKQNTQEAESRLIVYKNGIKQKVFYFLNEETHRFAYPFGMTIFKERFLIAGYNRVPRGNYKGKFDQIIYIIDINNDKVVGKEKVSNITKIYEKNDFIYMIYKVKDEKLLIKCILE